MKRLKVILLIILAVYVLSGVGLYFIQERIIFLSDTLHDDFVFEFATEFEEIYLTTEDDGKLNALHFRQEHPKGVILYFHGNAGTLKRWGEIVQYHVGLNYDVIIMDYRGYGKSTGKRSEKKMLADAQSFYDYAKTHYAEEEITVYGRSLGTTFATYVASQNKPRQLLLETPFHDLKSLAQRYYPIFPMGLALRFNFKSNEYMKTVTCPVHIFHGTEDQVVPYRYGKRLFETIPTGRAKFYTIPDGEHNNLIVFDEFREAVEGVLL